MGVAKSPTAEIAEVTKQAVRLLVSTMLQLGNTGRPTHFRYWHRYSKECSSVRHRFDATIVAASNLDGFETLRLFGQGSFNW